MHKFCWTMVLIFSVVSCDSVGPSFTPDVDLAVHQAQWRQHGIHDYMFDFTIAGVWIAPPPVRITVVADTVRSAILIATGAAAPIAGLPTVDSLFATVGRSIRSEMGPAAIEYDSKLGYPRSIDTISSSPPDAGFTITVRSLVPVVLTQ